MHFSVLEVYLTKNQISTKTFKKCEKKSSTLFHLSESGKLLIKEKTSLTETVIELFSTLRFHVHETQRKCIHSVTARQQTYCASNFEQGSDEVPSPSVLGKAKLWNGSIARNCWRNAAETLKMILA